MCVSVRARACVCFHSKPIGPQPYPVIDVVANPVRGLLDIKRSEEHLKKLKREIFFFNRTKTTKKKGMGEKQNIPKRTGTTQTTEKLDTYFHIPTREGRGHRTQKQHPSYGTRP